MKDNMKREMIRPKAGTGFNDPFIKWSDYYGCGHKEQRRKIQKKERRRARRNMKQQLKTDCADW